MTGSKGAWIVIVSALAITAGIYWVGLRGGFVFDDFSFVVGNDGVKVNAGSLREWLIAALSFPAGTNQGRWLTMLSFGLNYYFAGMDPYWFKLSNLCIHLLNGLIVFLALRALFDFHRATRVEAPPMFNASLVAAALASLWLVLPINLSAVLYVSQRLESLSNTFVFLGLWAYLRVRVGQQQDQQAGSWRLWLVLIGFTVIGCLAKESAILLPLYTASAELALGGFRQRDGRWNRPLLAIYGGLLVVPLVVGLFWLGGWVDGTRSFGRAFDIPQRLMTEARILFEYMQWTLLPQLDSLTLYHDDIAISQGLLNPPTTLLSILGIALLLGAAWFARRRFPLFAVGAFWYFGGHVLTATIIPLMLAFEHRNYFSSMGLLLALTAPLFLEGLGLRARLGALALAALFSFYAFTTALLAEEWSDPLRLAFSQALKRPHSANAQYAKAFHSLRDSKKPLTAEIFLTLQSGRKLPGAGIIFEKALIANHGRANPTAQRGWWLDLVEKLKATPANSSDIRTLHELNLCIIDKACDPETALLEQAYAAALSHGNARPSLYTVHAEFAWHVLADRQLAEKETRAAVVAANGTFSTRKNLVTLLLATNQLAEAQTELALLRNQDRLGIHGELLDALDAALRKKNGVEQEH